MHAETPEYEKQDLFVGAANLPNVSADRQLHIHLQWQNSTEHTVSQHMIIILENVNIMGLWVGWESSSKCPIIFI